MNDLGEKIIDLMAYDTKIIVNNTIIDNRRLNWREKSNGGIELTLKEIAKQINTDGTIYVWIELGLRGEIFLYNNYGDKKWCKHGETKGYA